MGLLQRTLILLKKKKKSRTDGGETHVHLFALFYFLFLSHHPRSREHGGGSCSVVVLHEKKGVQIERIFIGQCTQREMNV